MEWYKYGDLHRTGNKPVVILQNGYKEYYKNHIFIKNSTWISKPIPIGRVSYYKNHKRKNYKNHKRKNEKIM